MEENTKYGTSTVLLTSVTAEKGKSAEFEGFPCVSPLDDGTSNTRQIYMFVIVLFPNLADPSKSILSNMNSCPRSSIFLVSPSYYQSET